MNPRVCLLLWLPFHIKHASSTFTDESLYAGARITTQEEFGKTLDLFQQRGYNEVDTARVYVGGKQEAWTREVGWQERGLTLATKVQYPLQPGDNTADKVIESVEQSLKELGTNCVDLLYLHCAVSPSRSPDVRDKESS